MSKFDDRIEAAQDQIAQQASEDDQFLGPLNDLGHTVTALGLGMYKMLNAPTPETLRSVSSNVRDVWNKDAAGRTLENQQYLLHQVIETVKLHDSKLSQQDERNRLSDAVDHSMAYVGPTTSKAKLQLFALIAVSGAVVYPGDPIEQTEEYLRIVSQLHHTDVLVLQEISGIEKESVRGHLEVDHRLHHGQTSWKTVLKNLDRYGLSRATIQSSLARLQSQGLIDRIQTSSSYNGPGETAYMMLEFGECFLKYLTNQVRTAVST